MDQHMQRHEQTYNKIFFAVSALATLLVLTEIAMHFFGKSICPTEGCKVVAEHVRYGDLSILLIGLATFSLLALFSGLGLYANRPGLERYINPVLIISLACEGFFTGYQAFSIHTPCLLCLIIFGVIVILGFLRLASGEKEMVTGFAAFAAVFSMLYLVLPAGGTVDLPKDARLILFYSKDCKHCSEIMEDLKERKISASHLIVTDYAGFLKSMGIEHVPTLMVNDPYQKIFLTGKDAIRRYLAACSEAKEEQGKTAPKPKTGKAAAPARDTGVTIDIFGSPDLLSAPARSAADSGMCKEEEICK
jgi:hypothetical protein